MDLATFAMEKMFGFTPRKAVRIFLARMWVGYAFDAGEFAFLWVHVGMIWTSDLWRYIFYGYVGFIGLVAFLITFCCSVVFYVDMKPTADSSDTKKSLYYGIL